MFPLGELGLGKMNTTSASACLEVMIIFIHLRNGMNIFKKKTTTQREQRSKEKQEFTYASTSMTVTLNNAAH